MSIKFKTFSIAWSVINTIWRDPSNRGERVKRLIFAVGWQFFKRMIGMPIILKLGNGTYYIAESKSGNATGAIYTRIYEAQYISFIRDWLPRETPVALIDVGAHTGLYALWLSDLVASGILFEPADDNRKLLERNIGINSLNNRFSIRSEAVSDNCGEVTFSVTGLFSGTNRIVESHVPASADIRREKPVSIRCQAVKLDDFLSSTASSPSLHLGLLKVDTEGHELQVLFGARQLLVNNPSAMCLVENSDPLRIVRFFRSIGWAAFSISKEGAVCFDEGSMRSAYNLLAVGPCHPLNEIIRSPSAFEYSVFSI